MKPYDVTALGELLIDFTESGTSGQGNPMLEVNPGGAPGNVLAMLENLGRRCAFLGKVGQDSFGDLLTETVKACGIETRGLKRDPSVHTTLAFVHTLPDGDRFTAYRHMSLAGVLYKTADEDWEYFEEGTACAVAQRADDGKGYILRFQGMMTMSSNAKDAMKKKPRITGSSTPQGFGRPSAGPRDSEGPRTVENK